MDILVTTNASEVGDFARAMYSDQLPFVMSTAINNTAKDFQTVQREHMESTFTIRRRGFTLSGVKIKPFSSKRTLFARVSIDPPGGSARADILTKFEEDTVKEPYRGTRIAIPTSNVPRSPGGVIRKDWRPKALNLTQDHGAATKAWTKGGSGTMHRLVYRGDRKTFAILKPGGRGTIFERDGDEILALYQFKPRVSITPDLQFIENATKTVDKRFGVHFSTAFDRAVRTAR